MNETQLSEILAKVKDGSIGIDEAVQKLKDLPFEDLGHSKVDHHRALRSPSPEVILAQNKTSEHIIEIADKIIKHGSNVFITRLNDEQVKSLFNFFELPPPSGSSKILKGNLKIISAEYRYNPAARTFSILLDKKTFTEDSLLIITAGTSDIPIAEEAMETALSMGVAVETIYDAGVAGIHRLLAHRKKIQDSGFIIVIAGMEGALASVVGGLVRVPVIAVPTSVGYGASFNGLAALLGMLNSCSPMVSVVNIDNGFGAGYIGAIHILRISALKNQEKKNI